MRWKAPKVGDVIEITKYALLPITCYLRGFRERETRWLCFVYIHQTWSGKWTNDWFISNGKKTN